MAEKNVVFDADNVHAVLDGKGMLTVTIDTTKRLRPSRPPTDKQGLPTGAPSKSMIIGTTGGNRSVGLPDGSVFKLGITAYAPIMKGQAVAVEG
mgnify:FL=1